MDIELIVIPKLEDCLAVCVPHCVAFTFDEPIEALI